MIEYRICEECRYKNDVGALGCSSCGADLSFVMISEEEDQCNTVVAREVSAAGNTVELYPSCPKRVKIFDVCRHANDIGFMECESCDNDISYIRPTSLDENQSVQSMPCSGTAPDITPDPSSACKGRATIVMKTLTFTGVHDGHQITVPDIGGILGREGIGAEYLDRSNFVSREHAHLEYSDDKWMMTVLGTNPTLVNERVVHKGDRSRLEHGDLVRLADMDFRIELK